MVNTVDKIRKDFPILDIKINNKNLIYFDSAASSQKPLSVIESISDYYKNYHANIHRAFHYLGDTATAMYEQARDKVSEYVKANNSNEIIFTRGTTESVNLVAATLADSDLLQDGDEIILTVLEHHSNIVPWQLLAKRKNLTIKVVNLLDNYELNVEQLYKLINTKTKLIALTHVSNGLGVINPVQEIIHKIRSINNNILVLIDGAQALPNFKINVTNIDCDFYCFSGHKIYGPTGIGVLYAKEKILEQLPPYQGGGEMIEQVILPMGTTYAGLPQKFEAGTPDIAGAIGLAATIDYLNNLDFLYIAEHKNNLLNHCTNQLRKIDGIKIYADHIEYNINKSAIISFTIDDLNPQDVGLLLDQYGIAVRTGHHCNMPLMDYLNIPGTIRVSFGIYNTLEEVDIFIDSLKKVIKSLK